MPRAVRPTSFGDAASTLADAGRGHEVVRILGGQSKKDWGTRPPRPPGPSGVPDVELHTTGLDRIVEHNEGDLTAVLEAGVPLARAQARFAAAGQRLALDPWLGSAGEATIGGIVATGDCGPLRHRYGAPRDLVLGMTVALSDGTIARSGGKVIKNVAGYDVAKLFCGSWGTLGLVLSVNLRLHPLPPATATAVGRSDAPETLARAATELAGLPLELDALDVAWRNGRGSLLALCTGVDPEPRARRAADAMRRARLTQTAVVGHDAELWERQRAGQRSSELTLARVRARPTQLGAVIEAARACGATLVGRAGLGESFLELDSEALAGLSARLPAGAAVLVTDCPDALRARIDPWGDVRDDARMELMRRIKARFDPAGTCNPGVFVGGI